MLEAQNHSKHIDKSTKKVSSLVNKEPILASIAKKKKENQEENLVSLCLRHSLNADAVGLQIKSKEDK